MEPFPRQTRSLCPICRKPLPAQLVQDDDGQVVMEKTCPIHGSFSVPVWRGLVDFSQWTQSALPLGQLGQHCPENCGICQEHESSTCCCLLEVTSRCNLRCQFCFANGGEPKPDPSLSQLKTAISHIVQQCGGPLLQLSGGEPTLREDLPELISYAKAAGCAYVQLNTNGIRLAQDPQYAKRLAQAGLDIVFLQFDGTHDGIYRTLRGKPLLDIKTQAIQVCGQLGLGVTLVSTVVPGVNADNLGDLIEFAKKQVPWVRGVHFQPVSYFGRYPAKPQADQRYTLDQLMADISQQAGIPIRSFLPSRCDHPLCGFHSSFLVDDQGHLRPLSDIAHTAQTRKAAADNRDYVARHWCRYPESQAPGAISDEMDFDTFLYHLQHSTLTLSAMAFQDAMNLNIERLHRCSLHVYNAGRIIPFCANYLTAYHEENQP